MTITDDELDARLAQAAAAAPSVHPGTAALLVMATRERARSRMLRRRIAATAAGTALLIGGVAAAPAAAEGVKRFLAQSDWQPAAGGEILPDSEMVDLGAPDLAEYIDSIYPEWLPLAPGQTRAALVAEVAAASAQADTMTQEVGLRRALERLAYIGWLDEWIAGHAAGDGAREDAALAVIADAPTWPAYVATDGGGITAFMSRVAAALAAGRADAAHAALQMEAAPSWDGVDRTALISELLGRESETGR